MWDSVPTSISFTDGLPAGHAEWLRQSHQRCAAARVDRDMAALRRALPPEAIRDLLDGHAGLIAYTRLLFADIHRSLADQTIVFLLTDAQARVLLLCTRPELMELVTHHCRIRPGASFGEESCGTNAVALALRHRAEAAVCGEQHYCRLFANWNSVAAPVVDVDAEVSACVCIAASKKHGLGEKLALVRCLAGDIAGFQSHPPAGMAPLRAPAAHPPAEPTLLTARQQQVLDLFASGLSYKQIAVRIGIHSTKTIEEHLDAVRAKLGATSRRECIRRATEIGLLPRK